MQVPQDGAKVKPRWRWRSRSYAAHDRPHLTGGSERRTHPIFSHGEHSIPTIKARCTPFKQQGTHHNFGYSKTKMVRIKERYLLVNIIYPPGAAKSSAANVPDFVVQHQPTVERLTPQALLKGIRSEVGLLFGDCGLGAFEGNLSGTSCAWCFYVCFFFLGMHRNGC